MKPKFTEEKKEAVLLLINAFKEDDGYAHINLECLSDNFIGQDTTRKIIKELLLEGKLIDCTSQGFYRRYKIKNNQECPEFLFNQHLSSTNKTFILRCINLKLDITLLDNPEYVKNYFNSDYTFTKQMLYQIKKALTMSLKEYLSTPILYKTSHIYSSNHNLIKSDKGYQVDIEIHSKRDFKVSSPSDENVGIYVYNKITSRIINNYDRFKKSTITIDQLNEIYVEQGKVDFYTGEPFECVQDISADRINSDLLYDKDNIVLTHNKINMMKGTQTLEEFIHSCELVVNHFKNQPISKSLPRGV